MVWLLYWSLRFVWNSLLVREVLCSTSRETSNKGLLQGEQPGDRHVQNNTREKKSLSEMICYKCDKTVQKKPLSEIICYKCDKTVHYAQNCTEKTFHVLEDTGKTSLFGEGEVNRQHVKRIRIDSGASRTVVKRNLISPSHIGEEAIVVTFGNGTSGKVSIGTSQSKN